MSSALPLEGVIGFEGAIKEGLVLLPDGETLVYPLGATIVVRNKNNSRMQEFLQGHSNKVSCLAVSSSGRYLASGQVTHMGFTADIIVWDIATRSLLHRMSLHKVKVQALSFSHDEKFLASLGGQDDNALVVWDVNTGKAVCGSPTANDHVLTVKFLNQSHDQLVTGGNYNLNVWDFDPHQRKLRPHDCQLGTLRRINQSLTVDAIDDCVYVGTTSGDLLQVRLKQKLFQNSGPGKLRVSQGILCSAMAPNGKSVIVGGGDGTLLVIETASMKSVATLKLIGGVTSVVVSGATKAGGFTAFVGTNQCNIYVVRYDPGSDKPLTSELYQSCHFDRINGIAFPVGYSDVFATCSTNDIRIWHLAENRELLRIQVPNLICNCVAFMADGGSIISGWSDGRIRAFAPQSGKLLYTINDAHAQGVTAIAGSNDCKRIVSGGKEGLVRIWRIGPESQSMLSSMKDHKGSVNCVVMRANDSECVSASSDGSCIIWDLSRYLRKNSLFASTSFKSVVYHPDESQVVTCGTDRKVTWWDYFDGQAIRILDGSDSHEMHALSISPDGSAVVSAGGDKLVKLWGYDEGHCFYIGIGHSDAVTNVKVSPDGKKIVSVGAEGAIFIWENAKIH